MYIEAFTRDSGQEEMSRAGSSDTFEAKKQYICEALTNRVVWAWDNPTGARQFLLP